MFSGLVDFINIYIQMKKIVYILLSVIFLLSSCGENEPPMPIPQIPMHLLDDCFRSYLVKNFDKNKDEIISVEEAELVKEIICPNGGIRSLAGIWYFPNLEKLDCSRNPLKIIDLSQNQALKFLDCTSCLISELDISNNPVLEVLICRGAWDSKLQTLKLNPDSKLKKLDIVGHVMYSLDFRGHKHLKELYCGGYTFGGENLLTLDVSDSVLEILDCSNAFKLASVNIDRCTSLKKIICGFIPLDLSSCINLEYLSIGGIQSLDLSKCPLLKTLHCSYSILPNLDLTNNTALED